MKTTTKLLIFLAAAGVFAAQAFAGPPPPRPYGPPPPHGYGGSSGVRLAADIVSLVGASLDILRGPTVVQPVYTAPVAQPVVQPVYTAPVVQPVVQPVYTAPVVQPVVQPVYTAPVYTVPARPVYYPGRRYYYRY